MQSSYFTALYWVWVNVTNRLFFSISPPAPSPAFSTSYIFLLLHPLAPLFLLLFFFLLPLLFLFSTFSIFQYFSYFCNTKNLQSIKSASVGIRQTKGCVCRFIPILVALWLADESFLFSAGEVLFCLLWLLCGHIFQTVLKQDTLSSARLTNTQSEAALGLADFAVSTIGMSAVSGNCQSRKMGGIKTKANCKMQLLSTQMLIKISSGRQKTNTHTHTQKNSAWLQDWVITAAGSNTVTRVQSFTRGVCVDPHVE